MRYWNYDINVVQPTTLVLLSKRDPNRPDPNNPNADQALLSNNISSCDFNYQSLANTHSGLIGLRLGFQIANSNSGVVTLVQQVHVDNTP